MERRRRTREERQRDRQAGIGQWGQPLPRALGTNPRAARQSAESAGRPADARAGQPQPQPRTTRSPDSRTRAGGSRPPGRLTGSPAPASAPAPARTTPAPNSSLDVPPRGADGAQPRRSPLSTPAGAASQPGPATAGVAS